METLIQVSSRSNLIRNIHALNTRVDLISGGKLEQTAELTVAVSMHIAQTKYESL